MDTKALRQKILDLAIRGKLIPQDPNDEPASVLLERIREEKKQMVKEGKLKAKDIKNDTIIFKGEDNLHYEKFQDGTVKCIEDEIPFEVPEAWEWSRLSSITTVITDGEHKTPLRCEEYTGYYLLSARNIHDSFIRLEDVDYVDEAEYNRISPRCNPRKDDVLISCSGTVGRVAVVNDDNNYVMVRSAAMIRLCEINPEYTMFALQSSVVQKQMQLLSKQTAQANLFQGAIASLLVPIPSLTEQVSISQKAKQLLYLNDTIGNEKQSLLQSIIRIKAHILDLAIKGKLAPQSPDDEPASVLLERIRTEKEKLIKQGKLKRDKKESIIYKGDDNSYYEKFVDGEEKNIAMHIPFAVPKSWSWCRLRHIGNVIGGGTPKTAIDDYWDGDVPWITPADLSGYNEMYISGGARNISVLGLSKSSAQLMPAGTVLFSSRAPIGYVAIANNVISTNQGFKSFVPATNEITSDYMYYCLKAMCGRIAARASGTTFKEISGTEMAETLVPLPPVNEQKKIVECIKSFYTCINNIEASLN